jgi:hypothetical protein
MTTAFEIARESIADAAREHEGEIPIGSDVLTTELLDWAEDEGLPIPDVLGSIDDPVGIPLEWKGRGVGLFHVTPHVTDDGLRFRIAYWAGKYTELILPREEAEKWILGEMT